MNKLNISPGDLSKNDVSELHLALKKINLDVADQELDEKRVGKDTLEALKYVQQRNNLPVTGSLDEATLKALNDELFDVHHTKNKGRTQKLHGLLEKLEMPIAGDEKYYRSAGESTRAAIESFQKKEGLTVDGRITEELLDKLHEQVIKKTYSTKTQVGNFHATLLRAAKIAKVPVQISDNELKSKTIGSSTSKAIKSLQEKYKLPQTGQLDKATVDKLQSLAVSRGVQKKILKAPEAQELGAVSKAVRLNAASPEVAKLQLGLAHLGFSISQSEFKTQKFGKSTRQAVMAFQKKQGLPQTGHVEKDTLKVLNGALKQANPEVGTTELKYRVRGSVRDELFERTGNMIIHVHEKLLNGESAQPLATKKNHTNGFFDITYSPPTDSQTGQVKQPFHLVVKLLDANNKVIDSQLVYNVVRIQWVNFNLAGTPYRGESEFSGTLDVLQKALGPEKLLNIKETAANRQITQLSTETGLTTDDIMRLFLAHRIAANIANPTLDAETFYAFLGQNLPSALPGDLLRGTNDWEMIDQLVEIASGGIVFSDDQLLDHALDQALTENLVSPAIKQRKANILAQLKQLRTSFALKNPILIGNANLKSLLDLSNIPGAQHAAVANVFLSTRGINEDFWTELKKAPIPLTDEQTKDFATTVDLGNITKNHLETLTFLKGNIGEAPAKTFKTTSDVAKLDQGGWKALINDNGNKVPDNIPGANLADKVDAYAAVLQARAERVFPLVSLVAAVKRENDQPLQKLDAVETFVDKNAAFQSKRDNLDQYVKQNGIEIDDQTRNEIKTILRVKKLAPNSKAGAALIAEGLHSSPQIYFAGKNRVVNTLAKQGVDTQSSLKLYEQAKMQYAQVLARLMEFRREMHVGNPRAIIPQTYSAKEVQELLGDVPNLEALFGSLDFCECEHCQSLYSPAAYLTDLLRFLKEHDSLIVKNGELLSVKEVLFDRRPDLGNIKLNCENTNTPLPYVDLVCEILENNVAPQLKNFSYQTTLSQEELRAIPQNIRAHAYETLSKADFPIPSCFNLWQEEARVYLNYLRVPRHELIEAFQDRSNPANLIPGDTSIAAEYFGISSYETTLIITQNAVAAKQNVYWGFDTTQASVAVAPFIKRAGLSYYQLLELLMVKYANDPDLPPKSEVNRPVDTCDVGVQMITNLTLQKFDRMHRFIRLWRKTGWKMWELDLLIRNPKIGNGDVNGTTIANLRKFKELQDKLGLPLELLLAFYGDLNSEERIQPDRPDVKIKPLYDQLFQNPAITNPTDVRFVRPLDAAIAFEVNPNAPFNGYTPVPTILSALAIKQADFDLLKSKTNNHLSDASLSVILRHVYLARSLKLTVKDFLLLLKITNVSNPFNTLQITLDLIEQSEAIKASGLSLVELDYILNYSPDSSAGLREETITQFIAALRNILVNNEKAITELTLDSVTIGNILLFDADALLPMTDPQVLTAIQPLQTILNGAHQGMVDAGFAVEETEYILQFDPANGFSKAHLIGNIKALQQDLKDLLSQNRYQIVAHFASAFALSDQQAAFLLETLLLPGPAKTLGEIVADSALIAKNPDDTFVDITTASFPLHFKVYLLMHKISILIQRMKIETNDLQYFQLNHPALDTLDLAALPLAAAAPPNAFAQWLNLFRFLNFKAKYPEPEDSSLRLILDKAKDVTATKAQIHSLLNKLTQWSTDDLGKLDTGLNLKHQAMNLDYAKAEVYTRLQKCFAIVNLTGTRVESILKWAKRDDETLQQPTALETRQAVKSKYESDDWLERIRPLQDDLREKKRKALVAYHLENSQRIQTKTIQFQGETIPNPLYWNDSNALFKYFLIDVEMTPCQLTSRIKQAISSVQLFVQRCFLNLENRFVQVSQEEKQDVASENAWSQWKWMKNYRIWEANRKVFFYPENWIEPELRDDKSPFFQELENEILQNDVTQENVEAAFLNYLYKVDEVSHLEVCGLYHEMEELNPSELGYEINIVHVIARTKSVPPVYYYRKYDMNYSQWSTAWEKIEVDITGDQATPVIYNRKLHLFWLVFTEKPQKAKKVPPVPPAKPSGSEGPKDSAEPGKVLEVQLAWTIRRTSGWSSKKLSKRKLIHPWERPYHTYNVKPYYKAAVNELWVDIYLSTCKEFNNGKFYDPFQDKLVNLTSNRFNETYLPWHSASFVFDGDIKDIKFKGLQSYFHFEYFIPSIGEVNINVPLASTSFEYVHENFGEPGKALKLFAPNEDGPRLALPNGMHFENTHLTNNQNDAKNNSQLRVLENNNSTTLLQGAINPFELVITQQDLQLNTFLTDHPFFYQDAERAFFLKPEWQQVFDEYGRFINNTRRYRALPFYHPYTLLFIRELNRSGLDGLLNRSIQTKPQTFAPANTFTFNRYQPTSSVVADQSAQTDITDFSFGGAYSIYNWETFFHAPLMIAARLSQNQRFEEAMRWFHYIFDPTNIEPLPTPQRYWVSKPFYETNSDAYRKQRIQNILANLDIKENRDQLRAWRNNPFKPHLIARYRPVAYQRNVVMKYLDNLIAWGDQLFRRDTIESINEASLLYMLAYEILGDRPEKVPNVEHADMSFNEIEAQLDDFGNARIETNIEDTLLPINVVPSVNGTEPLPKLDTFYFCIPNNENIIKYWDVVEDRLFKIRHCMNIQGIVRTLPLFEPPIDPALLVKAAAAGIDLSSVLNDLAVGTPPYRFRIVMQRAIEFCNEVKTLGDKLLSALEKKDSEGLALLRSQHEIQLLEAIKEIKKKQVDEAFQTLGSLAKARELAEEKKTYYQTRDFMNALEVVSAGLLGGSILVSGILAINEIIASNFYLLPSFNIGISGFGGSPEVLVQWGTDNIARSMQAQNSALQHVGSVLSQGSSLIGTVATYQRRKEEWDFQGRLAAIEIDQVQFQINAGEIRHAIAEKDLENTELQIDNSKITDEYMRNKYTNQQLYNWMITKLSSVYFQAYQLAFDIAKKAEKCYQRELGIQDSSFIQFGYWDSLKKGLLAGENLMTDLRRLEAAHLDGNKRELEITKNVSLAQIAPLSLITLKQTGQCAISLPEWLFDMDYPGHYMRRIKSVSVSIPCIAGPYTSVNCLLSLTKNETRIDALAGGQYPRVDENDPRFTTQLGPISSIATSTAQNDSGMFELNFSDDRYFPFEGGGVISEWLIDMPRENNYFDFSSVSDLVLHIRYTARNGGGQLAIKANEQLGTILPNSGMRLFSLKHDFPTEWYKFLNPSAGADQEFVADLKTEHYPFFLRGNITTLKFAKVEVFIETKLASDYQIMQKLTNTDYDLAAIDVTQSAQYDGTPFLSRDLTAAPLKPNALGPLRMKLRLKTMPAADFKSLTADNIEDVFLLLYLTK
jgi:peptidoglycan hydrolase-like protein with peptidoglycan-binding domain